MDTTIANNELINVRVWSIRAAGAENFGGFDGITARSSHGSEIPVPRLVGGWGVGVVPLGKITKSQHPLGLVVLC